MFSLGLMAAFGDASAQGEIKTTAAKPDAAKGSGVGVKVKERYFGLTAIPGSSV
jgi:hypothetical protein